MVEVDSLMSLLFLEKEGGRKAHILNEISYAYRRLSVDSVAHYGRLALKVAQETGDKRNQAIAHKNIGIALYKGGGDYRETLKSYKKGLILAREVFDLKVQISCLNNIGLVYHNIFQMETSLKYYFEGLELCTSQIKEKNYLQGLLLGNIATSYRELGDQVREFQYFEAVIKYAEENKFEQLFTIYCDDYAKSLHKNKQSVKALKLCNRCLQGSINFNDHHSMIQTLLAVAEIKYDQKEYEEAIKYAEDAAEKSSELGFQIILSRSLLIQSKSLRDLGRIKEAIDIALLAYQNSYKLDKYRESAVISELLSELYSDNGDYENAYKYQLARFNWTKSNYDEKTKYEASELEAKYQNENHLKKIAILNKENDLKNRMSTLYKFGLSLLVIALVFAFYLFKNKEKAMRRLAIVNAQLSTTKEELNIKNEELEKYIDSNIQLEQFAHVASHDLRAPLITISSFSNLLKKKASDKLSDNEQKYLRYIQSNANQMFELVNDLLEYSKINSQKIIISTVNLQLLVENILLNLENQSARNQVNINLVDELPLLIADEIKLKRVFQNLITNAIKFSDKNKASKVEIYVKEEPDTWNFYIKDNGIGIREGLGINIFDPYVRLNKRDEYAGSGLGLSLCKKIIEQHGGTIGYDSVEGEGSLFYFTISKKLKYLYT